MGRKKNYEKRGIVQRIKGALLSPDDSLRKKNERDATRWHPRVRSNFQRLDCAADAKENRQFREIENALSAESETLDYRREIMFTERKLVFDQTAEDIESPRDHLLDKTASVESGKKKKKIKQNEDSFITEPFDFQNIGRDLSFDGSHSKNSSSAGARTVSSDPTCYVGAVRPDEKEQKISGKRPKFGATTPSFQTATSDPTGYTVTRKPERRQPKKPVVQQPLEKLAPAKLTAGNLQTLAGSTEGEIENHNPRTGFHQFSLDDDKASTVVSHVSPVFAPHENFSLESDNDDAEDDVGEGDKPVWGPPFPDVSEDIKPHVFLKASGHDSKPYIPNKQVNTKDAFSKTCIDASWSLGIPSESKTIKAEKDCTPTKLAKAENDYTPSKLVKTHVSNSTPPPSKLDASVKALWENKFKKDTPHSNQKEKQRTPSVSSGKKLTPQRQAAFENNRSPQRHVIFEDSKVTPNREATFDHDVQIDQPRSAPRDNRFPLSPLNGRKPSNDYDSGNNVQIKSRKGNAFRDKYTLPSPAQEQPDSFGFPAIQKPQTPKQALGIRNGFPVSARASDSDSFPEMDDDRFERSSLGESGSPTVNHEGRDDGPIVTYVNDDYSRASRDSRRRRSTNRRSLTSIRSSSTDEFDIEPEWAPPSSRARRSLNGDKYRMALTPEKPHSHFLNERSPFMTRSAPRNISSGSSVARSHASSATGTHTSASGPKPTGLPSNAIVASMLFRTGHNIDSEAVEAKIKMRETESKKRVGKRGDIPDAIHAFDNHSCVSSFSEVSGLSDAWKNPTRDLLNHFTANRQQSVQERKRQLVNARKHELYEA